MAAGLKRMVTMRDDRLMVPGAAKSVASTFFAARGRSRWRASDTASSLSRLAIATRSVSSTFL